MSTYNSTIGDPLTFELEVYVIPVIIDCWSSLAIKNETMVIIKEAMK